MILSDKTIAERIDRGELIAQPTPEADQVQPASLDLRMGPEKYIPRTGELVEEDPVVLEPDEAYICHTLDVVNLPDDVTAFLTGRSSVGRAGVIVHKTAGWIDPGWYGQLRLEPQNFSHEPWEVPVGTRVCQLAFFQLDQASSGYDGQYQGQMGASDD